MASVKRVDTILQNLVQLTDLWTADGQDGPNLTFREFALDQIHDDPFWLVQTFKLMQELQVSSIYEKNQHNYSQKATNQATTNELLSLTLMINLQHLQ